MRRPIQVSPRVAFLHCILRRLADAAAASNLSGWKYAKSDQSGAGARLPCRSAACRELRATSNVCPANWKLFVIPVPKTGCHSHSTFSQITDFISQITSFCQDLLFGLENNSVSLDRGDYCTSIIHPKGATSMKRRQFLQGAGLAATSVAVAKPAIAQSMPQIKWRLTASWPKSIDILYGACEHLAKVVAELS